MNNKFTFKSPKYQKGVTLVEVLVTVLVTSVGVMGVAAMQSTSLKMSYDSMMRTQATLLYYDLADRIRANPTADYELLSSTSFTTAPNPTCNGASASCTPDELKDHDLYFWWIGANNVLPNPRLTIDPPTGTETLTEIVIEWSNQVDPETESIADGDDTVDVEVRQKLEFQIEI